MYLIFCNNKVKIYVRKIKIVIIIKIKNITKIYTKVIKIKIEK